MNNPLFSSIHHDSSRCVCADDICVFYSLLTALTNIRETRHAEASMVAWNSKKITSVGPNRFYVSTSLTRLLKAGLKRVYKGWYQGQLLKWFYFKQVDEVKRHLRLVFVWFQSSVWHCVAWSDLKSDIFFLFFIKIVQSMWIFASFEK